MGITSGEDIGVSPGDRLKPPAHHGQAHAKIDIKTIISKTYRYSSMVIILRATVLLTLFLFSL